jgi:signal transduction histidine kinase
VADDTARRLAYGVDVKPHDRGFGPRWRIVAVVGPLVLTLIQIVGTDGASHNQPQASDLDPLAIVLVAIGPLSLLFLPRAPRAVLGFVTVVTFVYLARGYPYGPVFTAFMVAAIVNIVIGYRVAVWWTVGATMVLSGVVRLTVLDESLSWGWAFGVAAWVLVILAFGELIRVRAAGAAEARRAREETARRQAGEERLRIARELHDVVAHHMSLINVQAGVALHLVDRRPEQVETALATIKDASKEALTELRSLIGILRADDEAAPRVPVAMLDSLDDLVERTGQTGIAVEARIDGDLSVVPSAVELAAFRIIQEAITNVVTHSGATAAHVVVTAGRDDLEVRVDDNGRGLPRDHSKGGGTGIQGMRERAQALGGTVDVEPGDAGGTVVSARFPIEGQP